PPAPWSPARPSGAWAGPGRTSSRSPRRSARTCPSCCTAGPRWAPGVASGSPPCWPAASCTGCSGCAPTVVCPRPRCMPSATGCGPGARSRIRSRRPSSWRRCGRWTPPPWGPRCATTCRRPRSPSTPSSARSSRPAGSWASVEPSSPARGRPSPSSSTPRPRRSTCRWGWPPAARRARSSGPWARCRAPTSCRPGARTLRAPGEMTALISVDRASVTVGTQVVLDGVSLGLLDGDRIGVVGRNGGGKSTLLRVLAGAQEPDTGRVARTGGLEVGLLSQADDLPPTATVRDVVVGDRPEHEWAGDARVRSVLEGLLGGVEAPSVGGLDVPVGTMSGGEQRRIALAALLVADPDVLLLDEPTNHLDV